MKDLISFASCVAVHEKLKSNKWNLGILHIKRNAEASQTHDLCSKDFNLLSFLIKTFFRENYSSFIHLFSLDIFMQINSVADG